MPGSATRDAPIHGGKSGLGLVFAAGAAVSFGLAPMFARIAFDGGTNILTASNRAMVLATSAYSRVVAESLAHRPSRQGHAIQQQLWGAHSAGM